MRRLVLAIALLGACGDDDSGGGSIPIDDLQESLISKYCSLYVTCGLIDDAATCRSIYAAGELEFDADLLAAVDAGKVIYHPDKARECLNAIGGSCDANAFFENDSQEACDATFEGTVGAGGQCAINEECRSQDCAVPSCQEACCQGTCVGDAPVRSSVGGPCESSSQCVASYCDFATSTCAARKPLGGACTGDSQCEMGGCVNDMCALLPGPGEPCSSILGEANCGDLGYTCSTTSMTCVAYGLTGDPCMTSRECSPLYVCGPAATCILRPRQGEACDPQTAGCIDQSYCEPTTSVCTTPKADGATCMDSDECLNECDFMTNTCTTPPICI